MAAVTIEDCLKIIPNRFELALIASHRTEQLMNGAPILYTPKKYEKNTVIALREIGAGLLDIDKVKEEIKEKLKNPLLFKNTNDLVSDSIGKENDSEALSDSDLEDGGEEDLAGEIDIEEDEDFGTDDLDATEMGDDLEDNN